MRPQPFLLVCRSLRSARFYWSGRRDLNPRPLVPQTSALTGLRHAPTGTARIIASARVDWTNEFGRMLQPCRTQAAVTTSARASKRRSGGPFSILTGKRPKNFTSKPQRKTKVKPSSRQSMSSLQRVSVCRDVATEHGR
jgi:hypothetical protein